MSKILSPQDRVESTREMLRYRYVTGPYTREDSELIPFLGESSNEFNNILKVKNVHILSPEVQEAPIASL